MAKSGKVKGPKRKHRWATAKGRVVSVRFSDTEYLMVEDRAKARSLSMGEYLRWLTRIIWDYDGELEVDELGIKPPPLY